MPADKQSRNKKGSTCVACRQLKLKCDSADLYPDACTRCATSGRSCVVDPTFKRVTKRQHVTDLETELLRVRRELQRVKATSPFPSFGNSSSVSTASDPSESPGSHSVAEVQDQAIDEVHITGKNVRALIGEYYASFHPYFPILPDHQTFVERHDKNKLLLWTVLAIASSKQPALYASLVEPVRTLAGDLYHGQSRSFETVQALLLLCIWPFPFQQTVNDPASMYVGLATQIAYQIGLHRPGFSADYDYGAKSHSKQDEFDRRKTWLGCFVVNQMLALKLGVPSMVVAGHAIITEVAKGEASDIPKLLLISAHLMYFLQKATSAMGDDHAVPSGAYPNPMSLVRAFDDEVNLIRSVYTIDWPETADIFFHLVQLQILSFVLVSNDTVQPLQASDPSTNLYFAKASNIITILVQKAHQRLEDSRAWPILWKYCPMYAESLAIKMAVQREHGSEARLELLNAVRIGNELTRSWSMFVKDNYWRHCDHVDAILQRLDYESQLHMQCDGLDGPLPTYDGIEFNELLKRKTLVNSRMGVNALYDAVWVAKKIKLEPPIADQHKSSPGPRIEDPPNVQRLDINVEQVGNEGQLPPSVFDDFAFMGELDFSASDIWMDWQTLRGTT